MAWSDLLLTVVLLVGGLSALGLVFHGRDQRPAKAAPRIPNKYLFRPHVIAEFREGRYDGEPWSFYVARRKESGVWVVDYTEFFTDTEENAEAILNFIESRIIEEMASAEAAK